MTPFAFLPNLGGPELLFLGGILLLFFGNRLPSVMRSLGRGVTEFKKGVAGIEDEVDKAVTDASKEQKAREANAGAAAGSSASAPSNPAVTRYND